MRVGQTLVPGQHGTKRYTTTYGDKLICVRYRYDAATKQRYTTVELIVDIAPWKPPLNPETIVALRVDWGESGIARQIKQAGGVWNRQRQVWELAYKHAQALHLLNRIVTNEA